MLLAFGATGLMSLVAPSPLGIGRSSQVSSLVTFVACCGDRALQGAPVSCDAGGTVVANMVKERNALILQL